MGRPREPLHLGSVVVTSLSQILGCPMKYRMHLGPIITRLAVTYGWISLTTGRWEGQISSRWGHSMICCCFDLSEESSTSMASDMWWSRHQSLSQPRENHHHHAAVSIIGPLHHQLESAHLLLQLVWGHESLPLKASLLGYPPSLLESEKLGDIPTT
ncbi:unnamed protein product [Linum trigynum]|uniref:Uncharacterized protein n=1 Tax=Linum trigynum TaxID=586398 RepID=A0AAV2DCI5_9ROSI